MVAIKTLLDALATATAVISLAPVLPYLDRGTLVLAIVAVIGGFWCDRRDRPPLTPLPATLLALAGIAWYALQVRHAADIGGPLVNALAILLSIRLLTTKQARDYLQIFVLALFLLAGSSLLSLGLGYIVYLVLLVFAVTVSLVLLTVFVTDPRLALPKRDLWRLIRVALVMPAASLVLMLGFFVILPRTNQPLWNFLNPTTKAMAGLTESVSPGAFAQLADIKSLAFRAEGPELAPEDRYWRALVLNQPREGRWVRDEPPGEGAPVVRGSRQVTLTIYPEPRTDRYLVTLDRPQTLGGTRSQESPDQVFRTMTTNDRRFRYTVQAAIGADLKFKRGGAGDFYLAIPERISPRVAAVAARISASGADRGARLAALADFFRRQGLLYARDDLPGGPDPLDDFLFNKRRGYCEFFATAYVTLARLSGIPARLVGGYYGGEYNALGGYYLVTDDTAHLWAEVMTDDRTWQRVDPSQWAGNAGSALGAGRNTPLSAWQRLTDTLNYHWIQMVVVFDFRQQLDLLHGARGAWREFRPGLPGQGWRDWAAWGVLAGAAAGTILWWRQRQHSREARLLATLHRRVRKRWQGGVRPECLGLSELAERLDSEPCRRFAAIYQGAVFHDRPLTGEETRQLRMLLKKI